MTTNVGDESKPDQIPARIPEAVNRFLDRLPSLASGILTIEPLTGGLTNANYKVTTNEGDFVVRVGAESSGYLAIDRVNEYENSLAAAEIGIGAPVFDYLENPSVLVIGYIEGRTLSAADLREGHYVERVACACRQLHGARRFQNDFDMFALQRQYLSLVKEHGFWLPQGYCGYADAVEQIRGAMSVHREPTVPCNNDLLAENLIDDSTKIWIIDYEYSGNNEPSFELGNIWSESNLSLAQLEALVTSYYEVPARSKVAQAKVARARLWGVMSKYGWTLWASIQDSRAKIDFDFRAWGMEKYERAVAEFKGPDLNSLLRDVALEESDT